MNGRHVAIVGGGIVGLCCAYSLLERGHRVTLLERGSADHDCCSLGNAGYISPSHFVPLAAPGIVGQALKWMGNPESPFYLRASPDPRLLRWLWLFWRASSPRRARAAGPLFRDLTLASRDLFIELAAETKDEFRLVREGCLLLFQKRSALEEESEIAARSRELGMPARVLDPDDVHELEPTMTLRVAGGVIYELDAHVIPERFHATLTRLVRERGGTFLWNTEVRGWSWSRRTVQAAKTTQGEIGADEFVVAAGSASSALVRPLGLGLPLQPGKGYSMTIDRPRELPRRPLLLQEVRVAITPMAGRLRFGGTMELGARGLQIHPPRIRGIIRSAIRYLTAFRAEDFLETRPWCGLRPCSPDGLPYVGRVSRWENLSVASGHAMMGLSLAPITGRLVAEVISNQKPSIPLRALNPERYG
jgi:D-amino-acid dehydrogenase